MPGSHFIHLTEFKFMPGNGLNFCTGDQTYVRRPVIYVTLSETLASVFLVPDLIGSFVSSYLGCFIDSFFLFPVMQSTISNNFVFKINLIKQ